MKKHDIVLGKEETPAVPSFDTRSYLSPYPGSDEIVSTLLGVAEACRSAIRSNGR